MNRCPKRLVALVLFIAGVQPGMAQDVDVKWGRVPDEQVEMSTFAADTSASAVILSDIGNVVVDGSGGVTYDRHRRIKVLKPAGIEWATYSVTVYRGDRAQSLSKVEGYTYSLVNGRVKRSKMGKDAIFETREADNFETVRFTLPNVEPGSVIEYRYRIKSPYPGYVPDWTFQVSEPTVFSEYTLEFPGYLNYAAAMTGPRPDVQAEQTELNRTYGDGMRMRWAKMNSPAIRTEPYMRAPKDYRSRLQVQLAGYLDPGIGYVQVLGTWEQLAEDLRDSELAEIYKPSRRVRELAAEIAADRTNKKEIGEAITEYVSNNFAWDGSYGTFARVEPDDVLKRNVGSAVELNLLVVAMLRSLEINANALFVSTRDHGAPIDVYPIASQFDYVLAYVPFGNGGYAYDATDRHRPPGMLPARALVSRGWYADPAAPTWRPIRSEGAYNRLATASAQIDEQGTLTAALSGSDAGYAAIESFRYLDDGSVDDLIRSQIVDIPAEIVVDSAETVPAEGSPDTFKWKANLTIPGHAQVAGDFVYLTPTFANLIAENPLKSPERTFPVDFAYPRSWTFVLTLDIPDGYAVEELPAPIRLSAAATGAEYRRAVQESNGQIMLSCRLKISQSEFEPRFYDDLQKFFADIVTAEQDQLVLRRAEQEPDGQPEDSLSGSDDAVSGEGGQR